jgi:hypothetical protein
MKRIILMLTVAAFMVAAMTATAVPAFADPNCDKVGGNNKNCVVTGPGKSETTPAKEHNPNVKTTFHGRPQ